MIKIPKGCVQVLRQRVWVGKSERFSNKLMTLGMEGRKSLDFEHIYQNRMIQVIIKLIKERSDISKNLPLIKKNMFENIKHGMNDHQARPLLFKYYIS